MLMPFTHISKRIPAVLLFWSLCLLGNPSRGNVEFHQGDRIALIGNSLAERMQHDGWFETLLQSHLRNHQLVFRNLAFPGDTVFSRPRSQGSPTLEDYLEHCESTVVFAFFGYNESFAGREGVGAFENQLETLVDELRTPTSDGKASPRVVLFSPVAFEKREIPGMPDAQATNERLLMYSEAIRRVAQKTNAPFVDLFAASRQLYDRSGALLTINGVHLTETGNRQLAEIIASELTGVSLQASSPLEFLRSAVLEKNEYWFNRYRATDGNNVWGERSQMEFAENQTNADVLQNELVMFDVLTANRDALVWARAQGRATEVDDSNVPQAVEVPTNIGFWVKSLNEESEGTLNYLSGEEGIEAMIVPDGFKVNLFADEAMFPELVNPVQMAVDPQGRLWAAVWPNYPRWEPHSEMKDALLVFPDNDRDGVADGVVTFARVPNPTAFEFWNGGVLVASQPNIWFLRDNDGDDVADEKILMLSGIGSADTHHGTSNFIYGPDGGIYWQSGEFLVNNLEHPYGESLLVKEAGLFRFDPRRFTVQFLSPNGVNPRGNVFDYWGYQYTTNATSGECYQARIDEEGFDMHWMLRKSVRPVSANGIVSSRNFPRDYQQDFLICNTIGFLGIKRYDLARSGTTASYTEVRLFSKKEHRWEVDHGEIWGRETGDLLVSEDGNFRPSDIEFGADGALYIADWHNVIIGHMQHNVRDPNRDKQHGRIYRLVYESYPLQESVAIAGASLEQLMLNLEHPVDGVRYRTRIELSGRGEREVLESCKQWMQRFDPNRFEDAHPLLEALWLHQRLNVKDHQLLATLLNSPDLHVRNAAQRVQYFWQHLDRSGYGYRQVEKEELPELSPSGVVSETGDRVQVRIGTLRNQMRFDLAEFTVQAGKQVELTFFNPDMMPHNIVFVQPGATDPVAEAAMAMGADGFSLGYVPEDDRILAASGLVDYGNEEVLVFQAPSEPGRYEFVCTFPGHHLLMRGVMIVE